MIEYSMEWRASGACLAADPDLFFPVAAAGEDISRARRICDGCPVKRRCLDFAVQTGESNGIWGGTTPEERSSAARSASRRYGRRGAVRRVSHATLA